MSLARQQQGIYVHGDKVVGSPTHGGLIPVHGNKTAPLHGDPNLDSSGLTLVPVTILLGQSWDLIWARNAITEIPVADRPANDAAVKIFDNASQTIVSLVYGPLSGGGNEQQPGNAYLDNTFQGGLGGYAFYYKELRASGIAATEYAFGASVGGSTFDDTSAFGAAGNWTPSRVGGAYQNALANFNVFKAALAALGKAPDPKLLFTDIGINTASGSLAGANSFQADVTNAFLTQLVTDGVITNSTPIYHLRYSDKLAGTYKATIRTAEQNLAAAYPTRYFLMNADAAQPITGIDSHPTVGYLANLGKRLALKRLSIPHPLDNIAELGAGIYPTRRWEGASFENGRDGTDAFITSMYDTVTSAVNTNGMANATAGQQPGIVKATLSNGIEARFASFDGVNDAVSNNTPNAVNQANGFIMLMALKMTAANNAVAYFEARAASGTPLFGVRSDTTGNLCITLRDDANNLALSLASFGAIAFDNTMKYVAVARDRAAGTFKAWINGTACPNTLSWTQTAITLDRASIGASKVSDAFGGWATIGRFGELGIYTFTDYTAAAAYIAAMQPFFQREYGCP